MTPQEFWELVVTCLCLRGNFYAYKVKAFGEVAELLPVDPGCVVSRSLCFLQQPCLLMELTQLVLQERVLQPVCQAPVGLIFAI
ncbi:hypothetical protein WP4S18E08_11240 [Escherichia coli]|nr:hypothetical protein WP4S18E08_11240 [Escherichia coli]